MREPLDRPGVQLSSGADDEVLLIAVGSTVGILAILLVMWLLAGGWR